MPDDLYMRYSAIALFAQTAAAVKPLAELFRSHGDGKRMKLRAELFRAVAQANVRSVGEWIDGLIETDDNAFSRAAARGQRISDGIKTQVKKELDTFEMLSALPSSDGEKDLRFAPVSESGGFSYTYGKLVDFYAANGCGSLAKGSMFSYDERGFTARRGFGVRLSDLKNYAEEKSEIVKNTENFVKGLPAFHTLLSGERGTGKTSTVRSLAAEFKGKLKIIELDRNKLWLLPELIDRLYGLKQKYIVFIDGITADGGDMPALEDCLDARYSDNVLIYCTLDGASGKAPAVDPEFSDRFGLIVTYNTPDKQEFSDIFKKILCSRGMKWREEYASIAELAALKKGGRTPCAAKQIADLIETTYAELR